MKELRLPFARSSSISKSFSLAEMDMYSVFMEYRFDWRTDLAPSCDDMVFWRETGWKEEEEAVDARDGFWSITLIGAACRTVCVGICAPALPTCAPRFLLALCDLWYQDARAVRSAMETDKGLSQVRTVMDRSKAFMATWSRRIARSRGISQRWVVRGFGRGYQRSLVDQRTTQHAQNSSGRAQRA
jgi:hypothetical protein